MSKSAGKKPKEKSDKTKALTSASKSFYSSKSACSCG